MLGYWICANCKQCSRDRRKPKDDGCIGPTYNPDELQQWRWETERLLNGGINLLLVHPTAPKKVIRHFPASHINLAIWIEQYVTATNNP